MATKKSFDRTTFFNDDDPEISELTKTILTRNGVPEDELVAHVRAVRDKGWAQVEFPCIGLYAFLEFSIGRAMHYDAIVDRLKQGATLLDMGCCFGQDIRKLVHEGVPADCLTGTELEPVFIDLGYELFKDRDTLCAHFIAGDIFADEAYGFPDGSFDFVHTGSFFHQFSWDEQAEALAKCLRLLKSKAGSMLVGRQIATEQPGEVKHPALRSGRAYHHDIASWRSLVGRVVDDMRIKVEIEAEMMDVRRKGVDRWKMMRFCVTLQ